MTIGLRRARIPVVTAPFGFTFGGGCEITMGGDRVCAAAETYIGLVEVGRRPDPRRRRLPVHARAGARGHRHAGPVATCPSCSSAFEAIGMAKVATSGEEARELKYLRPDDMVEINRDQQLYTAKRMAIGLAEAGYQPPLPKTVRRCRARRASRPSR